MLGIPDTCTMVVLGISVLAIWFVNIIMTRRRLPPGPFPLPVFGNYLQSLLYKDAHQFTVDMVKRYGKIFHCTVGSIKIVHIADIKILNEAFVKNAQVFSDRPNHLLVHMRYLKKFIGLGVVLQNGPAWKDLRRHSLTAMRDLGVGKKTLEEKILAESTEMLAYIEEHEEQPHCYKPLMFKATSNIICSVVFGDRFDYNDPTFQDLLTKINKCFQGTPLYFRIVQVFPALSDFILSFKKVQASLSVVSNIQSLIDYVKKLAEERRETYVPGEIRDFIDLMLNFKDKDGKERFTYNEFLLTVVDFFMAGSDTTANILYWAMVYMAAYPGVQRKCQEEIDRVVGRVRPVSLSDKPSLNYVEATILETLRMGIVAPSSLAHCTTEDVELAGYVIPKDTIVFSNNAAMCRDPDVWTSPETFDPCRFLDDQNNIVNRELIMTFSVGPRSCVGEILAKMELSLMFPSMLQHYTIQPGSQDTPLDLEYFSGITLQGKIQDLMLIKRQ